MGDDLILVSVSSERYLVRLVSIVYSGALQFHLKHLSHQQHLSYASGDLMVDASFMQTLWNMNPVCSGCELAEGKLKAPAFFKPTFCLPYNVGHFICMLYLYAAGLWEKI